MLPQKNRITTQVFKGLGRPFRSWNGSLFTIRFHKTKNTISQYTVIVSKKVSARAVERNRIKRRLLALFRPRLFSLRGGVAVVIFAKKETLGIPFQELKAAVERIPFF